MISKPKQTQILSMYKSGLSANQVAEKLEITEHGVNYYLKKFGVKKRNISDAITLLNQTKFGKKQFKLKQNLSREETRMKTAGVMLYWAEGSKTGNTVTFTNSDPVMIEFFMLFLRRICGVAEERLRVQVHAYQDHNVKQLCRYWSRSTNIPISQFQKTYIHKRKGGTYKKISKYGTVAVQYSDALLLKTIFNWIQEDTENLSIHCHRSSVGRALPL